MTPEQRTPDNQYSDGVLPDSSSHTVLVSDNQDLAKTVEQKVPAIQHTSYLEDGFDIFLNKPITNEIYIYPEENLMARQSQMTPAQISQLLPAGSISGTSVTPGTLPPTVVTGTPPPAVTGLNLGDNGTHLNADGSTFAYINAVWTASSGFKIGYYEVRIKQGSGGNYSYRTSGTNAIEIFPLIANTPYFVSVRVVDVLGNKSAFNTDISITTPKDTTAPSVPTGLSLTSGFKVMGVKFNPNSESDLFAYRVQRSTTGAFAGEQITLTDVNSYFFVDQGLANSTTYYYRVAAVDTSGNVSAFCASVNATTSQVGSGDIAASTALIDQLFATSALVNELMVQYNGLGTTKITPGQILISGSTTLANWRNSTDTTKIDGGNIYTNTVTANAISVGNKSFTHNIPFSSSSADSLTWASGVITFGDLTTASISSGSILNIFQNTIAFVATGAALLVHFNEVSGTSVGDASSNSNTGTATGATASSTQSRFGGFARSFVNTTDVVNFPYISAYNLSGNIQLEASGYPTTLSGAHTLISKRSGAAINYGLRFNVTGGNTYLEFYYTDNAGSPVTHIWRSISGLISINNWYDIKLQYVFGTGSTLAMFINNVQIPGGWIQGTGNVGVTPTNIAVKVGAIDTTAETFIGYIDEVRIKNTLDAAPSNNPYYIYYNNSATLASSQTYSDAVGDTKRLLAVWTPKLVYGASAVQVISGAGTTIDGDAIKTGKISSLDGRTYFDLLNRRIIMNDGTNDRLIIGYLPNGF